MSPSGPFAHPPNGHSVLPHPRLWRMNETICPSMHSTQLGQELRGDPFPLRHSPGSQQTAQSLPQEEPLKVGYIHKASL